MIQAMRGTIHGKTIELNDAPEIPEGAQVDVFLRVAEPERQHNEGTQSKDDDIAPWWTEEDDRIFEQLELDRARWTLRELPE